MQRKSRRAKKKILTPTRKIKKHSPPDETLSNKYIRGLQTKLKMHYQDINRHAAHLCGNKMLKKSSDDELINITPITPHEETNLLESIRFLRGKIIQLQKELTYQMNGVTHHA